jgi:hypothetical protein
LDTATIARFARQIALPEIGPEGQERICGARVVVAGGDLTAEVAALYLRAAGAGTVTEMRDLPSDAAGWLATLEGADLVVRSGWDDDPMVPVVRRLGVAAVAVRARAEAVDLLAMPARAPDPDVTVDVPVHRLPHTDRPTSVVAGALAAAEGLWLLVHGRPRSRHLSLPIIPSGVPIAREIGAP